MIPVVGVVVVNYNGGQLTVDCLQSLLRTDWPAACLRVVLVDNASDDGVAARVRREIPTVEVLERAVNGGFGAGCNLGIEHLGAVDHVALVNSDAAVDPDWLAPLVDALTNDPRLGAACPKILFADRFVEIEVESETHRRGRGDRRALGVRIAGARVAGVDVWQRTQLVDGFWGWEPDATERAGAEWTGAVARLRLPQSPDAGVVTGSLLLSADRATRVRLRSGGCVAEHVVDEKARWVDVELGGPIVDVINNVGSELTSDGFGADRGYQQLDGPAFDEPADVFAWTGGAVLLRRKYLDEVGRFDERLFMYCEDLDVSWRGARRGWRYRYVPSSVVRHVHAASSIDGSRFKRFHDARNHLVVLSTHTSSACTARAAAKYLIVTASYARRDVVARWFAGRAPDTTVPALRLEAFAGFVRMLPTTLSRRRHPDGVGRMGWGDRSPTTSDRPR